MTRLACFIRNSPGWLIGARKAALGRPLNQRACPAGEIVCKKSSLMAQADDRGTWPQSRCDRGNTEEKPHVLLCRGDRHARLWRAFLTSLDYLVEATRRRDLARTPALRPSASSRVLAGSPRPSFRL